jgi:hypothetical protein
MIKWEKGPVPENRGIEKLSRTNRTCKKRSFIDMPTFMFPKLNIPNMFSI